MSFGRIWQIALLSAVLACPNMANAEDDCALAWLWPPNWFKPKTTYAPPYCYPAVPECAPCGAAPSCAPSCAPACAPSCAPACSTGCSTGCVPHATYRVTTYPLFGSPHTTYYAVPMAAPCPAPCGASPCGVSPCGASPCGVSPCGASPCASGSCGVSEPGGCSTCNVPTTTFAPGPTPTTATPAPSTSNMLPSPVTTDQPTTIQSQPPAGTNPSGTTNPPANSTPAPIRSETGPTMPNINPASGTMSNPPSMTTPNGQRMTSHPSAVKFSLMSRETAAPQTEQPAQFSGWRPIGQ